jgi:hypothetical protein
MAREVVGMQTLVAAARQRRAQPQRRVHDTALLDVLPVHGAQPINEMLAQTAVLAMASFERASTSGAWGSWGWGIAPRANSAIAPGRKTRQ